MFEKATRNKYRFESPQGQLTVEDLWDLPLTTKNPTRIASLDGIAMALHKQLREASEVESFVTVRPQEGQDDLRLQFEIVKHVIQVRLAENEAKAQKTKRAADKQQLLEIIARKQNAQLEETPIEELLARVNAL